MRSAVAVGRRRDNVVLYKDGHIHALLAEMVWYSCLLYWTLALVHGSTAMLVTIHLHLCYRILASFFYTFTRTICWCYVFTLLEYEFVFFFSEIYTNIQS